MAAALLASNVRAVRRRLPARDARSGQSRASAGQAPGLSNAYNAKKAELVSFLVAAPDLRAALQLRVEELDEQFFALAAAFLSLAKKDNAGEEVQARLELVYRSAMEVKDATLRPEIRLLNALLKAEGEGAREQLMLQHAAVLESEYFGQLLARITLDVELQPSSPLNAGRATTLASLQVIAAEMRELRSREGPK